MKKVFLFVQVCILALLSFSCTSVPSDVKVEEDKSSIKEKEVVSELEIEVVETQIVLSEAEIFYEKVKNISIKVISEPKAVTEGNSFKTPFSVKVENDKNETIPNFPLVMCYPVKKEDAKVLFEEVKLKTDSNGNASFISPKTTFSCNSEVSFYFDCESEDKEIKKIVEQSKISIPYRVKTNRTWKGGLISLVDYNAKGNAFRETFSSSLLLKELINCGFSNVGNFDIPTKNLENTDAIYKYVKDMVGNSVSYLIYGTIKYESPFVMNEDKTYSCTLKADFKCMDVKTGIILYGDEIFETANGTNDWQILNDARQNIAEKIREAVLYNM